MSARERDRDRGTMERLGERLGAVTGNTIGRGADMAANMVGSLLGSAMDNLGDWWSTADAGSAARSFDRGRDRSCRDHFESNGDGSTRDYDQVRPYYHFGHVARQNPEYRGRSFDDVEPDLRKAWQNGETDPEADWSEVRGYVGFGYSEEDESWDR